MARSRVSQALAAGADRLPRTGPADQFAAHLRSHETVSLVGSHERTDSKRDTLHCAHAVAADAALQQERESFDRKAVPHPLDFGRAFPEKEGTLGGESKSRARACRDPAAERWLEMPSMR